MIMKNERKIETLLTKEINFFISREWGSTTELTPLVTNIIYDYAIKKKKKVLLCTSINDIPEDRGWYFANLISLMTKIDTQNILAYLFPFSYQIRLEERKKYLSLPNQIAVFKSLETIKNSDLQINLTQYDTYGSLYFVFDEYYKNTEYDLIILKDFKSCVDIELNKIKKEGNLNTDEAMQKVIQILKDYATQKKTKFLLLEGGLSGYALCKAFKEENTKVITYNSDKNEYLIDTGEKMLINPHTNEILEFEENIIKKTFNERFEKEKLSIMYSIENKESGFFLTILKKYQFEENAFLKIIDFSGTLKVLGNSKIVYENNEKENNLNPLEKLLTTEVHYDYLILNDFQKLLQKTNQSLDEILTDLYNYSKYEETKIIIFHSFKEHCPLNKLEDYQTLKGYTSNFLTLTQREDQKFELVFELEKNNEKRLFALEEMK